MKVQLLVSAIGEDHPGIVARLTEIFCQHGANLEESRMALLGGEFAAVVLISVPEENIVALNSALAKLKNESITVSTKATQSIGPEKYRGYVPCQLTISGADHEGIVRTVASYLRDNFINIQSMESSIIHAPITGTPLFCMSAIVQVPPAVPLSELKKSLWAIADKESVEIEIRLAAVS